MQIHRRENEKAMEKDEEDEYAKYWHLRNQELQEADKMDNEEERLRNKELSSFLNMQKGEKFEKVKHDFIREQKAATNAQALIDQQEKHFYNYAEKCIKGWEGTGKNVKPLVLEIKGQAKNLHKAG